MTLVEAHEYPGGYGHTFPQGERYRFNAQLHYVWNCGEGQPVYQVLERLGLHESVTFEEYDSQGFDRMRIPGFALDIPYSFDLLEQRLTELFPKYRGNFRSFLQTIQLIGQGVSLYPGARSIAYVAKHSRPLMYLARYRGATLQDVFDRHKLPLEAQSLLASQWPDFLLPPSQLSIISWAALFTGYCNGAYYPTKHFQHVIDSLVQVINDCGGEIHYQTRVVDIVLRENQVKEIITESTGDDANQSYYSGKTTICNIDPQQVGRMIGMDKFPSKIQKLLCYEYSPSNFMAYCVVKNANLQKLGFAGSNLFHSSDVDLNDVFRRMYTLGDYSVPSFAITTPGLHTSHPDGCNEDEQIIEFLTVADYQRFLNLRISSRKEYNAKKLSIMDKMIDIAEELYIPNLREKMVFRIAGTPTTSERYCGAPRGNSYGSNMTPQNMGLRRLKYESSIRNLYFCNASAGYPGFAGTIGTGARLYERLTGDTVIKDKAL